MTASARMQALVEGTAVVPVVVVQEAAHAVPLARALALGGIGVMEVTLRSDAALDAIERIVSEVPDMQVGAGTVTTVGQVKAVARAGAAFVVTPGSPFSLMDAVEDLGLPVLPGAGTVTEMMRLRDLGITLQKFFPAEASGGTAFLRAVSGPLPELQFCPTGGISALNGADYLGLANVACVGGSWLTPQDAVASGDWSRVERLAREASALAVRRP
jgi:2-dehydro-3-deoxyphosphogluconate aldolase/(4S)-4-hydroxy-2-oxoglutarate aldolase